MNIKEILKPFLSAFIKHLRQESLSRNERKLIKTPLLKGLLEGSVSGYMIDGEKVSQVLSEISTPSALQVSHFVDQILDCIVIAQQVGKFRFRFRFYGHQALIRGRLRLSILELIVDSLEKDNLTFKRIEGENYELQEGLSSHARLFFDIEGGLSKITQVLQDYEKTNPHGLICIDYINLKRSKI